jgi:hypothetical protein
LHPQIYSAYSATALAFFYCDYKDTSTHSPLNILGAIARQIAIQNEECFGDLAAYYNLHERSDGSLKDRTEEGLRDLISKLALHFKSTMIIVDGLDEISKDRTEVTQLLQELNKPSGRVKSAFASRPEVDIRCHLEDYVQISIAAMSSDLRLYVASEIERRKHKLRITDPTLTEHIMEKLVDGADGM